MISLDALLPNLRAELSDIYLQNSRIFANIAHKFAKNKYEDRKDNIPAVLCAIAGVGWYNIAVYSAE